MVKIKKIILLCTGTLHFFLKVGKQKYPNQRKDSLQSPNVVGWDGGGGGAKYL